MEERKSRAERGLVIKYFLICKIGAPKPLNEKLPSAALGPQQPSLCWVALPKFNEWYRDIENDASIIRNCAKCVFSAKDPLLG